MAEYVEVIGGGGRLRRKTKNQTEVKTAVINKNYSSKTARKLSVYIGRPSKWGNPFPLVRESRRDLVCDQYEGYIATRLINGDITDEDFHEFDGKHMMCFCAPKRCHGDTLLMLYRLTHEERLKWAHGKVSPVHSEVER